MHSIHRPLDAPAHVRFNSPPGGLGGASVGPVDFAAQIDVAAPNGYLATRT